MRILIPLLALALGALVAVAVATRDTPAPDANPTNTADDALVTDANAADTDPGELVSAIDAEPSSQSVETDNGPDTAAPTATSAGGDTASAQPETNTDTSSAHTAAPAHVYQILPAADTTDQTIGALDPAGPFRLEAAFTTYGAGLKRVRLADYAEKIDQPDRYTLLDAGPTPSFYTLAARSVTVDGQTLALNNVAWSADPPADQADRSAVTYRVTVADEAGQPVADLVRTWSLDADTYELHLDQRVVNRTDRALDVRFAQYGVGDLLMDRGAYIGDQRQLITGYFRPENPPKTSIYIEGAYWKRGSLAGKDDPSIWPNSSIKSGSRIAWIASENRYFALVTHLPLPGAGSTAGQALATADVPDFEDVFPAIGVRVAGGTGKPETADLVTTYTTDAQPLAAGATLDLSMDVYAGPRTSEIFAQTPYDALHFDELIRYELGCTWCTFQWLAKGLLWYLKLLHAVVADWGVAIILLVVTVRLILHPITKRAQGNMMKMSKQMAAIQPEMQKLKEKYKDDPSKMNAEVMKLYKEKGVNPAGFLGCAPMLLQTPIWIALYAMLYLAIELRHEPAFYGVFQTLSGGSWQFLSDLSVSDRFIPFFDEPRYFNLLFLKLDYSALNVLPLLMGVVFFINMKFTTPPAQTEEQKQQQKIMKIMPLIFPIFLYSAPAGLTLYICCSTLAGIVDSYIVRKHIKQQEEAGTLFDKKEVKEGSFRWKMQQRMKLAQEMAAARMEEQQKGRKNVENTAQGKSYKNRKKK